MQLGRTFSAVVVITSLLVAMGCTNADVGDEPSFDTAVLTGRGEVGVINLWDKITDDCQRIGVQGTLPSDTLVGVTLVRNDCDPKMYFVGTAREGEDGWVSEDFLDPR